MMEFLLVFLILAWAVLGLAAAVTVVAGWRVRRLRGQGLEAARSIDTGRYGLYCSVSLFLILTVILWAVLLKPVLGSMEGLRYHSMLKPDQEVIVSALGQMHYTEVVRGATWIVAQVAVLLLLAVAVVLPSVLAELSPPEPGRDGSRLGRWLTQRGRHFALFASALAFWAALLFGVLVVLRLGGLVFEPAQQVYEVLVRLADQVGLERWLAEFGAGAHGGVAAAGLAGALLGVVSIGGRLFGPLARLHVPVDIALDVDNHFREFPAHATPRARISARLFSVLEAVADAGYDRVVIVAHSQGSVVAAELLRHLRLLQPAGWERMPEIRLFTCGCPLRQLYASRFPALYRWVETPLPGGAASGPQAAALGVSRWTNAYASGDYVGRWLWQAPGQDLLDSGAVYTDGVHRQLCLGKGAHTHYYDLQMAQVAHEIRLLVD